MKKLILLVSLIISLSLSITSFGQKKMYIWPSNNVDITTQASIFKGSKIFLNIFVSREITKKSKIECTDKELIDILSEIIRKTYPSASFVNLEGSEVPKDAITIKINIKAYEATFYTGMWHAATAYKVEIFNNLNNSNIVYNKDIESLRNFYNAFGYSTAKSNLKNCFVEANNQLFDFFKDSFLKMSIK